MYVFQMHLCVEINMYRLMRTSRFSIFCFGHQSFNRTGDTDMRYGEMKLVLAQQASLRLNTAVVSWSGIYKMQPIPPEGVPSPLKCRQPLTRSISRFVQSFRG